MGAFTCETSGLMCEISLEGGKTRDVDFLYLQKCSHTMLELIAFVLKRSLLGQGLKTFFFPFVECSTCHSLVSFQE